MCDINSGTENHLFLLNTKLSYGVTGKDAQELLEEIGITVNKNMLPHDSEKPSVTSGIRIGFAAITTRGATKEDAIEIAHIIHDYLSKQIDKNIAISRVKNLIKKFKKIEEI